MSSRLGKHRHDRHGFSLIELLIALAIGLVIGGTIITVMQAQIQLSTTQSRNMLNQGDLRDCINFMTEEIVTMGSGVVEPYIEFAEPTELMYTGDMNSDNIWERVHYFLDADTSELRRTLLQSTDQGGSWTTIGTDMLMENVDTLAFTYFADNNQVPVTEDDITAIEIRITVDTQDDDNAFTAGRVGGQAMVGRMTIRNRKMD